MHKTFLLASSLLLLSALPQDDPRAEHAKLVSAFTTATDGKSVAVLPDKLPAHDEFVSAARRYKGSEGELLFVGWLLQNAPRNEAAHDAAVAAVDALAERAASKLRGVVDLDEDAFYKRSRKAVSHLKYNRVADDLFAQTLLDAKTLARVAQSESIRTACERSIFKLENLQVGMVAPNIAGKDLDGVEFKLSDYRGKVVVLDFWGDW